jgi:hypothetical protein
MVMTADSNATIAKTLCAKITLGIAILTMARAEKAAEKAAANPFVNSAWRQRSVNAMMLADARIAVTTLNVLIVTCVNPSMDANSRYVSVANAWLS